MGAQMTKVQKIALSIACATILVAGFMLFKTLREYKIAQDEYKELNQYVTETASLATTSLDEVSDQLIENVVEDDPEEVQEEEYAFVENHNREDFPELEVDLDGLRKINPQVVGWLYVGSVGISYPVVQDPTDENNEYYLHHTLEGKENSSGSIFMDWEVDPNLTSWNTFIYGHNMKNGSMFGSLKKLINNKKLYEQDPYIYFFKDDGIYRYKIYSFYLDTPDTKMYYTCDTLKEYRAYVRTAVEKSVVDCDTEINEKINSMTLVTCSGSGAGKKRFFVHGAIQDRYLYE